MKDLVFWTITSDGINISFTSMIKALKVMGIRRYYFGENDMTSKPFLVEIKDNKVRQIDESYMLEILSDIIDNYGNEFVRETFVRMRGKLSMERLSHLPRLDPKFLADEHDCSYFFFRNGACKVIGTEIKLIPYSDIKGLIWSSQIVDHDISLVALEEIKKNLSFYNFLVDITSHDSIDSKERLDHLLSLMGYLIHGYKNPVNSKAVILMDENSTDKPQGGTGKTLIANAIGRVRKVTEEDGKNFKANERFAFQQVNPDTKIILLDDAHKHFDFERIFPAITSGLTIEKKNKDKFSLPFEDSPKILITTNYAISGVGASFRRRLYEFELSQHFNDQFTPLDAYKKPFFISWTNNEWDMFYCLMMECTKLHISKGVRRSSQISIIHKKLLNKLEPDFVAFANENIEIGKEYNKDSVYKQFITIHPSYSDLTKNSFSRKLDIYVEILDQNLVQRKSGYKFYFKIAPKIPK